MHCNTLRQSLVHNNSEKQKVTMTRHCNTLQHAATHCANQWCTSEKQQVLLALGSATHCNRAKQQAPMMRHCSTLQHTATHCNTLQHTATHCNTLQHTATHCYTLRHTATHCNTLRHTATHCHTHSDKRVWAAIVLSSPTRGSIVDPTSITAEALEKASSFVSVDLPSYINCRSVIFPVTSILLHVVKWIFLLTWIFLVTSIAGVS